VQRIKNYFLILSLTLAFSFAIPVQTARAQKTLPRPFEPLEELHFEAEFSRALLRKIDVADLKFHASSTPSKNASDDSYAITFKADISSKGFFARLFNLKFREQVESIV
jgi:hypothetical protein